MEGGAKSEINKHELSAEQKKNLRRSKKHKAKMSEAGETEEEKDEEKSRFTAKFMICLRFKFIFVPFLDVGIQIKGQETLQS